jgi:hypothetical protein
MLTMYVCPPMSIDAPAWICTTRLATTKVINRGRLLADGTPAEIKQRAGARRLSFRLDRVDEPFLLGLPGLVNLEVRGNLAHAADGATIVQIACTLYLSEGTVRNYLSSCIQKTGARNRAEALRIARERGWLLTFSPSAPLRMYR